MITLRKIDDSDISDDMRECENCGEPVGYLSSRDWCDGCELED